MRGHIALIAAAVVATLLGLSGVQAGPTDPEDPEALANVWKDTMVVFPHAPANYFFRAGRNMEGAVNKFQPQKLPAVVFLHGCNGLFMTSPQVTKMVRSLAEAGFVVFAPNSLDRPHPPYCKSVQENYADPKSVPKRLGELYSTVRHMRTLDWIDHDNMFVMGHSLGGWTLAQYTGNDFRAVAMTALTCLATNQLKNPAGVHVQKHIPVIAILGDQDEWFTPHFNPANFNCGNFSEMRLPNRKNVILPGITHNVADDPSTMPMIIEFFRNAATRPIDPVNR